MTHDDRSATTSGIVKEGVLDAVKIGSGETYLSAFGVLLGGTALQVGALSTVPGLIGAIAQSIGVVLVERMRSRRSVLSALMKVQGTLWIPIALLPAVVEPGWWAVATLIGLVALYQVTIGVISPVWNSLVGDVVPAETRGQFFGVRNRWMAVATFCSLLLAGQTIHQFTTYGHAMWGFGVVFLVAGGVRIWSAATFQRVADPPCHIPEDTKFSFWRFISRVRHSNFVRFVLFVSSMNFAVALSGPYFAMYMLRDLGFSYSRYTLVVATAVLAQFVVMRSWGRVSDQFGNRKILTVCGWLVAFNPFLWLVSSNFFWILLVQLYSGFFWAGFNLAAANFVFDAVSAPKRPRCVAYQAIINGVLVCLGSLAGGLVVTYYPPWLPTTWGAWTPSSMFLVLFFVSGVLRLLSVVGLLPAFQEVRPVEPIGNADLLVRVSAMRPLSGATFSFLSSRRSRAEVSVDDPNGLA